MMIFWIICALMLVIALLFVVLPLWLGNLKNNNVARDSANLEIFRDQIADQVFEVACASFVIVNIFFELIDVGGDRVDPLDAGWPCDWERACS